MAAPRKGDAVDPAWTDALERQANAWVPMFLARAAQGLTSVVLVSSTAGESAASVALLSPVEASALLRRLEDTRGSAKVAGTPSPGTAWAIGLRDGGHAVWSLAMTPILTRAG